MLRINHVPCISAKKGISFEFNITCSCYIQLLSAVITAVTQEFFNTVFEWKIYETEGKCTSSENTYLHQKFLL